MSDEATNVLRQALAATQSTDADQRKQGVMFSLTTAEVSRACRAPKS